MSAYPLSGKYFDKPDEIFLTSMMIEDSFGKKR